MLACCAAALAFPPALEAQSTDRVAREVADMEGDAAQLLQEPLRRDQRRSATYVEERLTDGELFYRLQDYVRSSIIFTDIVENHPTHRAFPDALFLLGDSLFRAGDYLGSRTRFRQLIARGGEAAFRPYLQRTLGRLIEVAIHTRDFEGVEDYFAQLSRIPPGEIEAATTYFRAKYLYNRAVPLEDVVRASVRTTPPQTIDQATLEQARQAFEGVQAGSPYHPQARYFIGVIHTLREQYPQAIEAFRQVLRLPADTEEQRAVIELTQLALGRLYYETDQIDQAVEAYQAVPRASGNFETALYEMAWAYIRIGDSTRAERALEVLSVAAPESRYIPDGNLLRGNLLLRNGRFEDANVIFRNVAREFSPVRDELDQLISSRQDPAAYFRQLVRDNLESFDAHAFLPPLAQRWAEFESDMDRSMSVLSDLSQARRLVRETAELAERLGAALGQPNRVAVFPDLRFQLERATAIRNRAARARRDLIRSLEASNPGAATELAEVVRRMRTLEEALGRMPTSEEEFAEFDDGLLAGYRRLGRELGRLEVELQGMEARITATQRYLDDTEAQRDAAGREATQSELQSHRRSVDAYREQIRQLRIALEAGRLQVGPGDERHDRHDQMRREYAGLVQEFQRSAAASPAVGALLTRVDGVERMLDGREQEIERVVADRTASIEAQLREETQRIEGYRAALSALEQESEEVVGAVTHQNFRRVRQRFYDLVLQADVGRIDVAWARREEHRTRVEMLTRDRAREMRTLDDEFREIVGEGADSSEEESSEEAAP
jgi:TolA-binding protein